MDGSSQPTDREIEQAAEIISRLPRGYLPHPLFIAITSKIVTPTMELVVLRNNGDSVDVLLTKRPDTDDYWPGLWHIPGTVILATDTEETYESCFDRLLSKELHGLVDISKPVWYDIEFWQVERGRELDQLYYAELASNRTLPEDVQFFSADDLPTNLMNHHYSVIAKAVDAYKKSL